MRFALCAYTAQGRDINLDVKRVVAYRHFCNKIWNAFKFSLNALGGGYHPNTTSQVLSCHVLTCVNCHFKQHGTVIKSHTHTHTQPSGEETPMDRWILSRLGVTIDDCNKGFKDYNFPQSTTALYNFWVYELCDVYLEILKPVIYGDDEQARAVSRAVLYPNPDV